MHGTYLAYRSGVIIYSLPNESHSSDYWFCLDAVVVRSCAGRIAPQLENLIFLDHVLNFTDVMIMHHTGQLLYAVAPRTLFITSLTLRPSRLFSRAFWEWGRSGSLGETLSRAQRRDQGTETPRFYGVSVFFASLYRNALTSSPIHIVWNKVFEMTCILYAPRL
jgi:hypothetical protein